MKYISGAVLVTLCAEIPLLLHLLWHWRQESAARAAPFQWLVYSWVHAAKVVVLFCKVMPRLPTSQSSDQSVVSTRVWVVSGAYLDDFYSPTTLQTMLLLTPVFYALLMFRTGKAIFGSFSTRVSVDLIMHYDMLWHVAIDMVDAVDMFQYARLAEWVAQPIVLRYKQNLVEIQSVVPVLLFLAIVLHGQSLPGVVMDEWHILDPSETPRIDRLDSDISEASSETSDFVGYFKARARSISTISSSVLRHSRPSARSLTAGHSLASPDNSAPSSGDDGSPEGGRARRPASVCSTLSPGRIRGSLSSSPDASLREGTRQVSRPSSVSSSLSPDRNRGSKQSQDSVISSPAEASSRPGSGLATPNMDLREVEIPCEGEELMETTDSGNAPGVKFALDAEVEIVREHESSIESADSGIGPGVTFSMNAEAVASSALAASSVVGISSMLGRSYGYEDNEQMRARSITIRPSIFSEASIRSVAAERAAKLYERHLQAERKRKGALKDIISRIQRRAVVVARKRSAIVSIFFVDMPFLCIRGWLWLLSVEAGKPHFPGLGSKNAVCFLLNIVQFTLVRMASAEGYAQIKHLIAKYRWDNRSDRTSLENPQGVAEASTMAPASAASSTLRPNPGPTPRTQTTEGATPMSTADSLQTSQRDKVVRSQHERQRGRGIAAEEKQVHHETRRTANICAHFWALFLAFVAGIILAQASQNSAIQGIVRSLEAAR